MMRLLQVSRIEPHLASARLLFAVALLLISFTSPANPSKSRDGCRGAQVSGHYFPSSGKQEPDAIMDEWFAKALAAMKEPSLLCATDVIVYRFLWLRTFHHPISVRVTDDGKHISMVAIELDGQGGYSFGVQSRHRASEISREQFNALTKDFSPTDFGKLPTRQGDAGLDGAEWIFEVSDHGKYHVVERWSPRNDALVDFGLRFLKLTGWTFNQHEIY